MRLASGASLVLVILLAVATSPWAADGWYLLIPPRSEYNESADFLSGYKILDNTPLSQWGQEGAYDSASECEVAKNMRLMVAQNIYTLHSDAYLKAVQAEADSFVIRTQRSGTEIYNANVWAFMASRCIRSDDPRLRR